MAKQKTKSPEETIEDSGSKILEILEDSVKHNADRINYNHFDDPVIMDDFEEELLVNDNIPTDAFKINGINME